MSDRSSRPIAPTLVLTGAACVLLALTFLFVRAERLQNPSEERSTEELTQTVSQEMREAGEELALRREDDPRAMGEVDAPVVMVVYSDYLCPFCGEWVRRTQPDIVEDYVFEGLLRIEWREFPYLGENSRTLALGAVAAAEQDAFWEYHARVYGSPEDFVGEDERVRERMETVAEELGLDTERFMRDMESDATERAVEEDYGEGQAMGVSGTPAFLINGDPVLGAQPLEAFTETIELALRDEGR